MNKKGRVLRNPHTGPGLLIVEGRQYRFWLDQTWGLDVPPRPGLEVDVTFNSQGQIHFIAAVSTEHLERAESAQQAGLAKLRRMVWNAVERCFH